MWDIYFEYMTIGIGLSFVVALMGYPIKIFKNFLSKI